jgi:fructose-bisphosphate aldolase, class II
MHTLSEYIAQAEQTKTAIGHFNISNIEGLWAVVNAAENVQLPAIIGLSEGERDFVGFRQMAMIVKDLRERKGIPVFLNADHTYSYEKVTKAIDEGADMVIIDGAKLSLDENIALTKRCVAYAREKGSSVLVEGELGYIGQSSKVLDEIPEGVDTAVASSTEDVARFVTETGVDLLAPSVGNFHGMLRSGDEPLHLDVIASIRQTAGVPLVLHGGSGISHEEFVKAIEAGIAVVHISTELRVAYRGALMQSLTEHPDEIAPYKYLRPAKDAMQKAIEEKMKVFSKQ